jgi:hypothetical protein
MVMSKAITTYEGGTAWFLPFNDTDLMVTSKLPPKKLGDQAIWIFDASVNRQPLIFYSPDVEDESVLSPNDPIWEYVDSILEKLWANSDYVSAEEDDRWLDEIRSSWGSNVEDMFDEFNSGE